MSKLGKIGIYGVLAALVTICMWAFFQILDPHKPKSTLESSLIGTNPGLDFRPHPPDENTGSTLIWYKGTGYESYKHYTDSLTEFLKVYKTPGMTAGRGQNIYNCDYNQLPPPGQVCDVDIRRFGPCTEENNYSYHRSSPCVFLKLNKMFGWTPEFYNDTEELPSNMPNSLKEHIIDISSIQKQKMNTVWLSCEGENPPDQEYIGPIQYMPMRGFPGYYFPYLNSEGYLSPLVAVHFERPKRGVVINIECKVWARNIIHDGKDKIGSAHFELLID